MPRDGYFSASPYSGQAAYLARVVAVDDPDGLSRVQLRVLSQHAEREAEIWARVAVPFAGKDRGAFFIPDVDDEVLVVFIGGDTRFPVVVGSLWNGHDTPPEALGGSGTRVDRWTLTGKAGTRIAIVEESPASATISFETPNGVQGTLSDQGAGKIELSCNGSTLTMEPQKISIQSAGPVEVQASQVKVSAGMVQVDAGLSSFSGVVRCDTLIASTVVSTTYTPGAGNIW